MGRVDRLRAAARPHLMRLRVATGDTTDLIVLDGDHAVCVVQMRQMVESVAQEISRNVLSLWPSGPSGAGLGR